jgi:hypothetical protein
MVRRPEQSSAAVARLVALTLCIGACGGGECLMPPCPLPLAITLTVADSASGAPVPGASLAVSGVMSTQLPCSAACSVGGYAGTYYLDLTAPGYRPAHRQVAVAGTSPRCGCPSTETQHVAIALPRVAGSSTARAARLPAVEDASPRRHLTNR